MTLTMTDPCYVFAVVDGDVADDDWPAPGESAVQDVRVVRSDGLAAVVGSVQADRRLGRAADLRLHDAVVAALLERDGAVLPLRFGSVLSDERAVTGELLVAARDRFAAALDAVRGRVQYTVTVRYDQDTVLAEILRSRPDVAALRRPAGTAAPADQIRLGERVVAAMAELRAADLPDLIDELAHTAENVRVDADSAEPDRVLRAAALVPADAQARFVDAIEAMARRGAPRLRIRLVGPVAPYDFVPED